MRLTKLTAQNFRGFTDLQLDFAETNVTVFIGTNGCGKSSVLDLIAIHLNYSFQIVKRLILCISLLVNAQLIVAQTVIKTKYANGQPKIRLHIRQNDTFCVENLFENGQFYSIHWHDSAHYFYPNQFQMVIRFNCVSGFNTFIVIRKHCVLQKNGKMRKRFAIKIVTIVFN